MTKHPTGYLRIQFLLFCLFLTEEGLLPARESERSNGGRELAVSYTCPLPKFSFSHAIAPIGEIKAEGF
jgi:hypothetical protein